MFKSIGFFSLLHFHILVIFQFYFLHQSVCIQSLSHVQLFVTPWTVACQASLSIGFSRQEYCSGLPFPPPWDLSHPGIKPSSLVFPALAGGFFTTVPPGKLPLDNLYYKTSSAHFSSINLFTSSVFKILCTRIMNFSNYRHRNLHSVFYKVISNFRFLSSIQ